MRISSRGTVSMGPLGWLIFAPLIAAYWILYAVVWLLIHAGMAVVDWNAARGARKHLTPPS